MHVAEGQLGISYIMEQDTGLPQAYAGQLVEEDLHHVAHSNAGGSSNGNKLAPA